MTRKETQNPSQMPPASRTSESVISAEKRTNAPLLCPMCGRENAPDAVFCANADCHKALGEFKYVQEELAAEAHWHEHLAEKATAFIGKPHFLVFHLFWFALWIAVNTGLIMFVRAFDTYPFALLGILLTAEAIFITGFVLISQNRQNAHADKRAELDYEVNVRTYREISAIDHTLSVIIARLDTLEAVIRDTPSAPQEEKFSE